MNAKIALSAYIFYCFIASNDKVSICHNNFTTFYLKFNDSIYTDLYI